MDIARRTSETLSVILGLSIIGKPGHVGLREMGMLDKDLAELYGVLTGNLNKAVKLNVKRFPVDFMFQLTKDEFENLKFQFGISSWGGSRSLPYAFAEQGVAMLSGILNPTLWVLFPAACCE